VKHDRNAIGFGGAIDNFQFLRPVQIIIRKKQLVRRMDLYHAQFETQDLFDLRRKVIRLTGMNSAARNQAFGIGLYVFGDELIHLGREPNHVWRNVIDQHCAINARSVQILEE
jgi:hypothetical protein